MGIIGRSGAGKSTLLKVLSRITYPTTGRMRVRGRVAFLLVTSIDTWTAGYNLESVRERRGYIDVRINALNINPDRYSFSFCIAGLGPKYHDQLDLCPALDIEAADVHNSGRSLSKWYGLMFISREWANHHLFDGADILPPLHRELTESAV